MNADTEQIKAACRKVIELAEKATPGKWFSDGKPEHGCCWDVMIELHDSRVREDGGINPNTSVAESSIDDAAFIATARTFTPAAARATSPMLSKISTVPSRN